MVYQGQFHNLCLDYLSPAEDILEHKLVSLIGHNPVNVFQKELILLTLFSQVGVGFTHLLHLPEETHLVGLQPVNRPLFSHPGLA